MNDMLDQVEDRDGGGGFVRFESGEIYCLACFVGRHQCCVELNVLGRTFTCECQQPGCLDRYYGLYCRECHDRKPGCICARYAAERRADHLANTLAVPVELKAGARQCCDDPDCGDR